MPDKKLEREQMLDVVCVAAKNRCSLQEKDRTKYGDKVAIIIAAQAIVLGVSYDVCYGGKAMCALTGRAIFPLIFAFGVGSIIFAVIATLLPKKIAVTPNLQQLWKKYNNFVNGDGGGSLELKEQIVQAYMETARKNESIIRMETWFIAAASVTMVLELIILFMYIWKG